MTIANKLTIFRIFLIPVMIIFAVIPGLNNNNLFWGITTGQLIFMIIFIIASFTDFLDGYLARKRNEITTFGKFLDPIADKLLVLTALIFLIVFPRWNGSKVIPQILVGVTVIIIREFVVTGIRLLAVDKGKVIAASKLGKIKTATTMVAIIIMLFNGFNIAHSIANKPVMDWFSLIFFWLAILFTIISGVDYFVKNKEIIFESV